MKMASKGEKGQRKTAEKKMTGAGAAKLDLEVLRPVRGRGKAVVVERESRQRKRGLDRKKKERERRKKKDANGKTPTTYTTVTNGSAVHRILILGRRRPLPL